MLNSKGYIICLIISIIFIGVLLVSFNSIGQAAKECIHLNKDLYLEEIEENVYLIVHNFPWPANSLLVRVSSKDYILVDTPYTPEATKVLVDWLKSKNENCSIVAINTGFHIDNLGGNEYLLSQNIPIYGSDLTLKLIEERSEKTRAMLLDWLSSPSNKYYYEEYKNLRFRKPNNVFNIYEGLKLEIGDEIIVAYYPGVSHSPDNIVVYFRNRNILFGGCMIKSLDSNNLGFTGDADISEWFKSAKKVLKKYSESRIVIPGHGIWGGTDLIKHTLKLLSTELE